jgi:hypothetical protein
MAYRLKKSLQKLFKFFEMLFHLFSGSRYQGVKLRLASAIFTRLVRRSPVTKNLMASKFLFEAIKLERLYLRISNLNKTLSGKNKCLSWLMRKFRF